MTDNKNTGKFDVLTLAEFAELMSVDVRTVRNWINVNGLPSSAARNGRLVNGPAAVAWHYKVRPSARGTYNRKKGKSSSLLDRLRRAKGSHDGSN
jgi:hypothetical protein